MELATSRHWRRRFGDLAFFVWRFESEELQGIAQPRLLARRFDDFFPAMRAAFSRNCLEWLRAS
jgi:hypothetical protein